MKTLLARSPRTLATALALPLAFTLAADAALAVQATSTQWLPGQRQGMNSVSPVGLLVGGGSSRESLVRSSGVQTARPGQWSTTRFGAPDADSPDYSPTALLAGLNRSLVTGASAATVLELAAFSTGSDVCGSISTNGNLSANNGWHGLSISLAPKPSTETFGLAGSVVRSLDNPHGTLVAYYLEGSAGIDSNLIDSTAIEQTDVQLGFSATEDVDIQGADWAMGAIANDPDGSRTSIIAPTRDRLYFTISEEWSTANSGHLVSGPGSTVYALTLGNIYLMKWEDQGGGTYGWSGPEVAFPWTELAGTATAVEIDGLSVYYKEQIPTPIERVIFSTAGHTLADQIMGYDRVNMQLANPDGLAVPLRNPYGDLVSGELGLDLDLMKDYPDDIDGMCAIDPESGLIVGGLGTTLAQGGGHVISEFGLSVYRGIDLQGGTPADVLTLHANGLKGVGTEDGIIQYEFGYFDASQATQNHAGISWSHLAWGTVDRTDGTSSFAVPGDLELDLTLCFRARYFPDGELDEVWHSAITGIDY